MKASLFHATIEDFEVIPYFRMTRASKWSKQARRYLDSQAALAWRLGQHWQGKDPIGYPVEISFKCHFKNRRIRDYSNVLKAIEDAMQYAAILENDRWIHGNGKSRVYFDGKARLVVELRRL